MQQQQIAAAAKPPTDWTNISKTLHADIQRLRCKQLSDLYTNKTAIEALFTTFGINRQISPPHIQWSSDSQRSAAWSILKSLFDITDGHFQICFTHQALKHPTDVIRRTDPVLLWRTVLSLIEQSDLIDTLRQDLTQQLQTLGWSNTYRDTL